jgi:hypothetical protein
MKKNTATPLSSTNNPYDVSYELNNGRVVQLYLGKRNQSVNLNQLRKLSTTKRSADVRTYQHGVGHTSYLNYTAQIIGHNLHIGCVTFTPQSSRIILQAAGVYKTRKSSRKARAAAA